MNVNDMELWGGVAMILLSAALLLAPFVVVLEYTVPLLVVGVLGLAIGSMLIGFSRRGRAA